MSILDKVSIPVWVLISWIICVAIGRFWQYFNDRDEIDTLMRLVNDLVNRITLGYRAESINPLAEAMIGFRRSLEQAGSSLSHKIHPVCIHAMNPDDCPICRH